MKIFRTDQIKSIDRFTIINEPISSIDFMERAAGKVFEWFISGNFHNRRVIIVAGPGNNGGDGLALARMLATANYSCEVWSVDTGRNNSGDWLINRNRLSDSGSVKVLTIADPKDIPAIPADSIIIDALFGTGLSKPVEGLAKEVIRSVNRSRAQVISIDIPSGLSGEDNSHNDPENIIKANHTLSFQFPKLAFMFPENERYTGEWTLLPIGLHPEAVTHTPSPFNYLGAGDISAIIKKPSRFAHKGTFGHGLLIGGSKGKMGSIVLASSAALRTGAGLVTCQIPSCGNIILQTAVPEVMTVCDPAEEHITLLNEKGNYDAVAVGPGLGTHPDTQKAFISFIEKCSKPLVIDADGLNILALNRDCLKRIPEGTVLTPHPGEFERLAGKTSSGYERLLRQIDMARDLKCIIVLKGANTSVATPDGQVYFNSTGNPGMATAGSGDTLTGMILAFLAQGYTPGDAARAGVFLHGLAGDLAARSNSERSLIASDIIKHIGEAFNVLTSLTKKSIF